MASYSNRLERAADRRVIEKKMGFQGYNDTPLLDYLLNNKEVLDYGRVLEEPVASTPVDRSQWFDNGFGDGSFWTPGENDMANNFAMWQLSWKKIFTPTVIDEIEAKIASGGPLQYLDNQLMLPSKDHRFKVSNALALADGTNRAVVGIRNILSETGTGTYGGLTRKYFPALLSHVVDGSDVAATEVTSAGTMGGNTFSLFENSNVITISGDYDSSNYNGKDIVLTKSGAPTFIRTIVANDDTTASGRSTFFLDDIIPVSATGYAATIRSKLYSSARYGGVNKFSINKIENAIQRCGGRVKHILTEGWGFGHILEATRQHEIAMTDEQRKSIGFSGYHRVAKVHGADVFLDASMPSGEFYGVDLAKMKLCFLQDYEDMRFRRTDGIKHLFPNGQLALAATGYVLINVLAFGCSDLKSTFRLHSVTG